MGESAPVVVAFTKSDLAYPHISGSESGHYQYQDRTRTRAYAQCEQLCRSLFRREARDVPAELVSGNYFYSLRKVSWTPLFVCSDATIRCSYKQSNCDDWPIHHGLACCPFVTVQFTRSEATDRPRSSCVVRGFESVSGYYHSSFHRVSCLSPDTHLIYLFWFTGSDEAVSISTLRTNQFW
jgi:hypothetical protein